MLWVWLSGHFPLSSPVAAALDNSSCKWHQTRPYTGWHPAGPSGWRHSAPKPNRACWSSCGSSAQPTCWGHQTGPRWCSGIWLLCQERAPFLYSGREPAPGGGHWEWTAAEQTLTVHCKFCLVEMVQVTMSLKVLLYFTVNSWVARKIHA